MAIIINNTSTVKTLAENLLTEVQNVKSARDSIAYVLEELNEYWSSGQDDQQAFAKGLSDHLVAIDKINNCNKEFAGAIKEYMEVTEKTANSGAAK